MIDGMSIKSHLQWDSNTKQMTGYVDMGIGSGVDDTDGRSDIATQAVVLLAVGLVGHWKVPVAYFLCDKLSAHVQLELVKNCIIEQHSIGLIMHALVWMALLQTLLCVRNLAASLNPTTCVPCSLTLQMHLPVFV